MKADGPVLDWREEPYAVVFKPSGFPVGEGLASWAAQALGGSWVVSSAAGTVSGGLVLLSRPGAVGAAAAPPPVRGTYALLITTQAPSEDAAEVIQEAMDFWGGPGEEARVVQSAPSGHFGHVAAVEIGCGLSGRRGLSPLGAVLAMQELGFAVLRVSKGRSRDVLDPRSQPQTSSQKDVLPGTCVEVIGLSLPESAPRIRRVRDHPAKWSSFLTVEQGLAAQRSKQETVDFCGLSLLVPSEQLRPRISSAPLVHAALDSLKSTKGSCILDLGVGCGALLLAVLAKQRGCIGTGVDIDEGAIAACQANASRVLQPKQDAKVSTVLADFTTLDVPEVRRELHADGYDVIVCNPPYRSAAQQEAYKQASGQHGGYAEHDKTLVAGETGLEMYEAVAACLVRDMGQVQKRLLAPPGPILKLNGSLIFQVEAGSFGRVGGVALRVAAAVQAASNNKLKFQRVIQDEKQLDRAILIKWSFCD